MYEKKFKQIKDNFFNLNKPVHFFVTSMFLTNLKRNDSILKLTKHETCMLIRNLNSIYRMKNYLSVAERFVKFSVFK